MFNLTINNFRCFTKQNFEFSRINILIGENSSGKSSLLKFLLMLKQSNGLQTDLNLNLKDRYVDLANYYEIINQHNIKKKITFSFEFSSDYVIYFKNFLTENYAESTKDKQRKVLASILKDAFANNITISHTISSQLNNHKSIITKISNALYGELVIIPKSNLKDISPGEYPRCTLKLYLKGQKELVIENVPYEKKGFSTVVLGGHLKEICKSKYKINKNLFIILGYFLITQNYIQSFLDDIQYVSPVQSIPERAYLQEDNEGLHPVKNIKDVINILTDPSINEKVRLTLKDGLNELLNQYGIAKSLKIVESSFAKEVRIKVTDDELWCNLKDVGYGVALQIPILFQALLSDKVSGETILIEQPEVHIHPKLQSQFIETLLSIGKKNSYFIETHSEHILRKLQVLIKDKLFDLKKEDVSVYYFRMVGSNSIISKHLIDDNGSLNPPLPSGFFDSSYKLAKQLLS